MQPHDHGNRHGLAWPGAWRTTWRDAWEPAWSGAWERHGPAHGTSYTQSPRRRTLRAVDAAGAARGLGAIWKCGAVPSPVPV